MEKMIHKYTCNAGSVIEPKEEMLDDLVITDDCEDDTDVIIPKEELPNTSVHLDVDLNKQKLVMVMPIKTELILSKNITELRRQYESSVDGSLPDKDVCAEHSVKIKQERHDDASVDAAYASRDALLLKKCSQSQRGRAAEKQGLFCNVCEKQLKNKKKLYFHMRTHIGDTTYSCDICKNKYTQKCHLIRHMRGHTGEKPFSCAVCQMNFTRKDCFTIHMGTHKGEHPYSCDVCRKNFTRKDCLTKHMRIHTGEQPYSCEVCQNKFTQIGSLNKHMRAHTGQKPFSCDVCQKNFRHKFSLNKHMRVHTGKKRVYCDVCRKNFTRKYCLAKHMRTHTGKQP